MKRIEKDGIKRLERKMVELFSKPKPFSPHLTKWEDNTLPDKYDHNSFVYCGQPSEEEWQRALQYQRDRGDSFIKLEGDEPLSHSFGLEQGICLTMAFSGSPSNWKTNKNLIFKKPTIKELETIEIKHYGESYGVDFCRRNIQRLYGKLHYIGAYFDEKPVGIVYYYAENGYACFDGLLVDRDYRQQAIGTSLIAEIARRVPEHVLILHADADDTPKEMYEKMGFQEVARQYEYLGMEIEGKE